MVVVAPRLLPTASCSTCWFLVLLSLSYHVQSFSLIPIIRQQPRSTAFITTTLPIRNCRRPYTSHDNHNSIILGHFVHKDGGDGDPELARDDDKTIPTTTTSSSSRTKTTRSPSGEFAYQEMIVLLTAMKRQGVTSKTMDPVKRNELEGYIRTVLATRNSEPLASIGQALLPSSEWKLLFSTSSIVVESLPNDATVVLNILDSKRLDYTLQFSKKTLGLNSITARCHYTFDVRYEY